VTILTRGRRPDPFGDAVQRIVCDRNDGATFGDVLHRRDDWDAVVDFMALRRNHAEDVVRHLAGRTGHYVLISSAAVYELLTDRPPVALQEADAVADDRFVPAVQDDYAIGKLRCEQVLRDAHDSRGFPTTSLRLPFVQGPWDYTMRSWRYQLWIESGKPVDVPGGAPEPMSHVFSEDVVSAIVACLDRGERTHGRVLNIAQAGAPTLREYLECMALVLGRSVQLREVPSEGYPDRDWQPYVDWTGRGCALDISAATELLGFRPKALPDWLETTCCWFNSAENPFEPPPNPPWER